MAASKPSPPASLLELAAIDAQVAQLDAQRRELATQQAQLGLDQLALTTSSAGPAARPRRGSFQPSDGIQPVSEDGSTALVSVAFAQPRLELSQATKTAVIEHFESDRLMRWAGSVLQRDRPDCAAVASSR